MSLSPKLIEYRSLRIAGKSRYQAAKIAGYSREMALRASRLDDAVAASLNEILEKEGMDAFFIAEQIKAGLSATRITVDKNGTLHEHPDMFIRHKYLDTLLDIGGHKKRANAQAETGEAPQNLPQMIINTLNITMENRKVVDVIR